jgi:hypothetical protein
MDDLTTDKLNDNLKKALASYYVMINPGDAEHFNKSKGSNFASQAGKTFIAKCSNWIKENSNKRALNQFIIDQETVIASIPVGRYTAAAAHRSGGAAALASH